MGQALIKKMWPALAKMEWPDNPSVTQLGRKTYEIGLDKADEYRDDARALAAALRTFQSGDSRPYAFAGAAYTLFKASREQDGSYTQYGLDAALQYLEKAQELAPDVIEINMIEAFIYIYSGRYDDARLILDYLEGLNANNYHLLRAEIAFWQVQGDIEETIHWHDKAVAAAETVPQKLRLRNNLGDFYLAHKKYDKAVEIYKEAIHFARENAMLWHNLSMAYWYLGNEEESARCNKKALQLRPEFPKAQQLEAKLKERMGEGGFRKRLLGH